MRNDKSVTLRVSEQLVSRTDALRRLLEDDPEICGVYGPPSRATLWRLAILRGLEVLEKKYAPGWDLDEQSADELDVADAVPEAVPLADGEFPAVSADPVIAEAFGMDPPDSFPTMFDGIGGTGGGGSDDVSASDDSRN